jgi:hypothetical protein
MDQAFSSCLVSCCCSALTSLKLRAGYSGQLMSALAQIQLKVNTLATAPTGMRPNHQVAELLRNARSILRSHFNDDIEILRTIGFSVNYISFCEFLITSGDEIDWEECARLLQDLHSKAQELHAKASNLAGVCEELREQLHECRSMLSDFLQSNPGNEREISLRPFCCHIPHDLLVFTERSWVNSITNFLSTPLKNNARNHDLVDSFDSALKDMVLHQYPIAEFWKDQETLLAALDLPAVRAIRMEPERLRSEIAGWHRFQAAFLSANSSFPPSASPVGTLPHEHAPDITMVIVHYHLRIFSSPHLSQVLTPITSSLMGLVRNAGIIKHVLSAFRGIIVSMPAVNLKTTISEHLTKVHEKLSARFHEIKCYLATCGDVSHAYRIFYDHHLLRGPEWHVNQISISEMTSQLLATAQSELTSWGHVILEFRVDSPRLSSFFSKYMPRGSQAYSRLPRAVADLDCDRIQAYIEGATHCIHSDVIDYDAALRSMRRQASSLCALWEEEKNYLKYFALDLRNGRKPSDDELKNHIKMWTTIRSSLEY